MINFIIFKLKDYEYKTLYDIAEKLDMSIDEYCNHMALYPLWVDEHCRENENAICPVDIYLREKKINKKLHK